jgi:hypothetical protein
MSPLARIATATLLASARSLATMIRVLCDRLADLGRPRAGGL